MPDADGSGRFPASTEEAITEKLALLEQMASLAREQEALAGNLTDPGKAAGFDRLSAMRRRCMEKIDDIDKYLTRSMSNKPAQVDGIKIEITSKMKIILKQIQETDKKIYAVISKERAGIKNQIADLSCRKKSMLAYNTNMLGRKSMIVDKSR